MKLKEMTPNQLRKLVIEQDKIIKRNFKLLKQILHDWKFWSKIHIVITITLIAIGFLMGWAIGGK